MSFIIGLQLFLIFRKDLPDAISSTLIIYTDGTIILMEILVGSVRSNLQLS